MWIANMIDQKLLRAAFWGLCFIMAVKQRNMMPNILCPDSSTSVEVLGQAVDVGISGMHFLVKCWWYPSLDIGRAGKWQLEKREMN
jgi:hypothetical protein